VKIGEIRQFCGPARIPALHAKTTPRLPPTLPRLFATFGPVMSTFCDFSYQNPHFHPKNAVFTLPRAEHANPRAYGHVLRICVQSSAPAVGTPVLPEIFRLCPDSLRLLVPFVQLLVPKRRLFATFCTQIPVCSQKMRFFPRRSAKHANRPRSPQFYSY